MNLFEQVYRKTHFLEEELDRPLSDIAHNGYLYDSEEGDFISFKPHGEWYCIEEVEQADDGSTKYISYNPVSKTGKKLSKEEMEHWLKNKSEYINNMYERWGHTASDNVNERHNPFIFFVRPGSPDYEKDLKQPPKIHQRMYNPWIGFTPAFDKLQSNLSKEELDELKSMIKNAKNKKYDEFKVLEAEMKEWCEEHDANWQAVEKVYSDADEDFADAFAYNSIYGD